MVKSLGDFNIEQSSFSDIKNIKWTKKNSLDVKKPKNKNNISKQTSPTNIIYHSKIENTKEDLNKNSKVIVLDVKNSKNKKKKLDKKIHNSSASHCRIEQGFRRPGR